MPEKKKPNHNDSRLIYMPQHQSFIQNEVTAVISWASHGSSLALEMFQALFGFTAARLSQEQYKVQLHSLKGTSTTGFPLGH